MTARVRFGQDELGLRDDGRLRSAGDEVKSRHDGAGGDEHRAVDEPCDRARDTESGQ